MIYFFEFIVTTVTNTITYYFNTVLFSYNSTNITLGHTILYFGLASLALGFFLSFFQSANRSVHSYARQQRYDK